MGREGKKMIHALIPARGGSKRIPKKNLEVIGGKTLVEWSIAAALLSKSINRVFVSSDDHDTLELVKDIPSCVGFKRKAFACTDDATDRDVVIDFLDFLPKNAWPELIVYLRPTTPFRRIMDIDSAIQKMIDIPAATGLRSVHEMSESAYKCFEIRYEGWLFPSFENEDIRNIDNCNAPNHFYPKTYHPNGVVDIIRLSTIRENLFSKVLFGNEVVAHITEPTIEIDTPFDLQMARFYNMHRQPDEYEVFK